MTKIGSIIIQLDFINWQAILHWPPSLFFFFFESLGIYFCCCLWFSFMLNKFNSLRFIHYFIKFSKIFSALDSLNSGALDELFSQYSSVQFSCSVVSDSLWAHGLQHTRPPCPSPTPRVYPYSCPLSQWCHRTILSSVIPFSSCPQSFLGSESFPVSWLFASSGLSIYWSFSFSISPSNEYSRLISFRTD